MHSLIEGTLTMSWFFTAFLVSFWTMKALTPKEASLPVAIRYPRYRKAA